LKPDLETTGCDKTGAETINIVATVRIFMCERHNQVKDSETDMSREVLFTRHPCVEVMSVRLFVKHSFHTGIKDFSLQSAEFVETRYYKTSANLHLFFFALLSRLNNLLCFVYCIVEFTLPSLISVIALYNLHFPVLSALLHYVIYISQSYQRYCIM
jgi:hypothetical protein